MLSQVKSTEIFSFLSKKTTFLVGLSFLVFIFSLTITLDLAISLVIFILSLSLVIFVSSFSQGWLFLLSSALLFSSLRIGEKDILFFDFCLLSLILIGLFKIFLEKGCLTHSRYDLYFFSIIVLSLIGSFVSYKNNGVYNPEAVRLALSFSFYWFMFLVFQYFFQTEKRIRRFFWVLIFCSLVQAFKVIILAISNWKTSQALFDSEAILIVPFLIVGIFSSWGMWSFFKKEKSTEKNKVILYLIQATFFFQLISFILVSDPKELVFLGIGFLFLGILSRDRKLVLMASLLTLIFSFFSYYLAGGEDFSQSSLVFIRDLKTASVSLIPFGKRDWSADFFQQNNSYFYFWGNLGILGILSLIGILANFFSNIYEKYKKSDGEKRIWLMTILGILIAFLMLAFKERVFFFGPSAIIFWLLAGVVQNLGSKTVSFGLTETHLNSITMDNEMRKVNIELEKTPKNNFLDSCQPRFDFYKK